jgi:hypothetical protein
MIYHRRLDETDFTDDLRPQVQSVFRRFPRGERQRRENFISRFIVFHRCLSFSLSKPALFYVFG